ncbi:conserved hypothetical protein [Ricinus communis]|uniref:Uncharacterized protein n=1 Tax=Ricinus communis TaxID=3988 RepID=B9T1E4_RICCO|nr:conserved hypothetical protein [Ricinus communis]
MENQGEVCNKQVRVNMDGKSDEKKKTRMRRRKLMMTMEDDDINERADAFIKNFHNQLRIQREESFKRFQEMISRGV